MQQAELVIRVVQGQVTVSGPIHDKVLCYGLLECAKDAIKDFNDKSASAISRSLIVPAITLPTNGGKG